MKAFFLIGLILITAVAFCQQFDSAYRNKYYAAERKAEKIRNAVYTVERKDTVATTVTYQATTNKTATAKGYYIYSQQVVMQRGKVIRKIGSRKQVGVLDNKKRPLRPMKK